MVEAVDSEAAVVLVVDDDPVMRRVFRRVLEPAGYSVVEAADGAEALERLNEPDFPAHIAIVDWKMPRMSGGELCQRVRSTSGRAYTYLIVSTGAGDEESMMRAFAAGADDYIAKPFSRQELVARVKAGDRVTRGLTGAESSRGPVASNVRTAPGRPPRSAFDALAPGIVLDDRYELVEPLSAGAMGVVWKGIHKKLDSPVAVKFMLPRSPLPERARRRFMIEAKTLAQLQSPHTVRVFDYGMLGDETPYLVMEYVDGATLADSIASGKPMSPNAVVSMVSELCDALIEAHGRGLIHRDVKPSNVMLVERPSGLSGSGRSAAAKLVDFGLVKATPTSGLQRRSGQLTLVGELVGTPRYMSPECLMGGAPDPHCDLWGVASCAFLAMTGKIPFDAPNIQHTIIKVCHEALPVPSTVAEGVPAWFDEWFARACAREKSERFPTAAAMAEALSRAATNAA